MKGESGFHDAPSAAGSTSDPVIPDQRVKRRLFAALAVGLVVLGAVSVVPRAQVDDPKTHASDFTCYTAAGRAIYAGEDPYLAGNPSGWRYLYAPPFAILVAPLALLHPQVQVAFWFSISVLLAFACYDESVRLLRAVLRSQGVTWHDQSPLPLWLRCTPFLSVFLYGITTIELGQVSILVLYLILLGARLVLTGDTARAWAAGGAVLAGAVILKIVSALVAATMIAALLVAPATPTAPSQPQRRAAAASAGIAAGLLLLALVIPVAAIGWSSTVTNFARFWHGVILGQNLITDARNGGLNQRNQTFTIAAAKLGNWVLSAGTILPPQGMDKAPKAEWPMSSATASVAVGVLNVLLACTLLAAIARLARLGSLLAHVMVLGLANAATLLFSPISWSHHFVLLVPLVLYGPFWLLRDGRRRLAMVMAAVPIAFELAHYLLRSTFRLVGGLGVSLALWAAVLSVLVLTPTAPAAQGRATS